MKNILANNQVESVLRILSGTVGLIFLVFGLGFLIMPEIFSMMLLAIETRAVGINSLRGDFGALFLGMSFFCLLGAVSAYRQLLFVPIVFLTLLITGRLISFIVDGLPVVMTRGLVSEIFFLSILILTIVSFLIKPGSPGMMIKLTKAFRYRLLAVFGIVALIVFGSLMMQQKIGSGLWDRVLASRMQQNSISDLADGLHVGLAGTGSPMPDAKRVGVCTFVKAGTHMFIVDTGPGSTHSLELMRVPLQNVDAVLFTHFHSDHIADLGEFLLKAWAGGKRKIPMKVIGPEGVDTVVNGFNTAFSLDAEYRYAHHGDAVAPREGAGGVADTIVFPANKNNVVIFDYDEVKVTAFIVDHRPVKPALGYRFDYKGRSLVISGDTLPNEELRRQAQGVDLLLHGALQPNMLITINRVGNESGQSVIATVAEDILTYHTFPEEAARIAHEADVRYLVLHHIIPPMPMNFLNSAFLGDSRKYYKGPITVGEDGMIFSMPPNSTKIIKKWIF